MNEDKLSSTNHLILQMVWDISSDYWDFVLQRYKYKKSSGQVNLTYILKKCLVCSYLFSSSCCMCLCGCWFYYIHIVYIYFWLCASLRFCINFVVPVDHVKQFLQVKEVLALKAIFCPDIMPFSSLLLADYCSPSRTL